MRALPVWGGGPGGPGAAGDGTGRGPGGERTGAVFRRMGGHGPGQPEQPLWGAGAPAAGRVPRPLLRGAVPGGESPALGRPFEKGGSVPRDGQQPVQPASQRAGLPGYREKSHCRADEGQVPPLLVSRDRISAPGALPHPEGPGQRHGGYQRRGPAQAGLPGPVQRGPPSKRHLPPACAS